MQRMQREAPIRMAVLVRAREVKKLRDCAESLPRLIAGNARDTKFLYRDYRMAALQPSKRKWQAATAAARGRRSCGHKAGPE